MRESTGKEVQPLDSGQKLLKPDAVVTSENLPKNVSLQLYALMGKVVQEDVNPKTVRAACDCADAIHKFLKLNLEIRKSGV